MAETSPDGPSRREAAQARVRQTGEAPATRVRQTARTARARGREIARLDMPWARCAPVRLAREGILQGFFGPVTAWYAHRKVEGLEVFDGPPRRRSSSWPTTPATWTRRRSCARCPAAGASAPRSPPRPTTSTASAGWRPRVSFLFAAVPISRLGGGMDKGSADHLHRLLRRGWNLLLYPEGTRSRDGSRGKLHSGRRRAGRRPRRRRSCRSTSRARAPRCRPAACGPSAGAAACSRAATRSWSASARRSARCRASTATRRWPACRRGSTPRTASCCRCGRRAGAPAGRRAARARRRVALARSAGHVGLVPRRRAPNGASGPTPGGIWHPLVDFQRARRNRFADGSSRFSRSIAREERA